MKLKTHKGALKRIKLTGKGKLTRTVRKNRNSRFSRTTSKKPTNTDKKFLVLQGGDAQRVKKLINI